jgi:Cdc6-like AAA superfamily ATPase
MSRPKEQTNIYPRQPMIMLVCGETGVGKTYRNKQEIRKYLKDDLEKSKTGRKVLAFDTNDDDYPEFRTVSANFLHKLSAIAARRIRPFNADGSPMDDDEKREVVEKILRHYRNGLLVLDDIDHYLTGAKGQAMIGALCTVRHKNLDILFTHQSIAKITTTEWQNCTWLRLHHQVDDIHRYRDRIPKYDIVRIAQIIIDEQYELVMTAYRLGKLTEAEFQKRRSYFLYINMRKQRIVGCTKPTFIRACKKFIDQEKSRKIKLMLAERDFKNQPIYKNRNEAIIKKIADYLHYLDE